MTVRLTATESINKTLFATFSHALSPTLNDLARSVPLAVASPQHPLCERKQPFCDGSSSMGASNELPEATACTVLTPKTGTILASPAYVLLTRS